MAPPFRSRLPFAVVPALLAIGCGRAAPGPIPEPFPDVPRTIAVSSRAFADGGAIPKVHTCDGTDGGTSPPLGWTGVPPGTASLALLCEDPDAPLGTFTHWVLTGLTGEDPGVPENLPKTEILSTGAWAARSLPPIQGRNDFGKPGYGGPCPPSGTHRYVFRVFALDFVPTVEQARDRGALLRAAAGHVRAQGRLVGTYRR